ncbi:MAG: acyltransferase [Burkholderiales bacterium]
MRQLTFTRFIAAMSVVVYHWSLHTPALKAAIADYQVLLGPTMVSYFFVLSGFIMAAVYYRPGTVLDPWRYWTLRIARVYPVYLLGLMWMAALLHFGIGDTRHDWKALLLGALMLQAWSPVFALSVNAPGWSLSSEAFFYLVLPFVIAALARSGRAIAFVVAIAAFWLASQLVFHAALIKLYANTPVFSHATLFYNPALHLNSFLVGVGAGVLLRRFREPARTDANARSPFGTLTLIVLTVVAVISVARNLDSINAAIGVPFSPTNGLFAPLFALLLVALAIDHSVVSWLFALRPLVVLGEISYAIYILHTPVAWSVRTALGDDFALAHSLRLFVLYFAALIGVSYASYRWLETPIRQWVRRRLGSAQFDGIDAGARS